jgi:DNA-binding NtrC family response regulator
MDNYNNKGDNNNRILLVDDEIDITTIYTLGLQDNGFKVDAFNDPLQALSDFKSGSYDFVLIDYKMPKMNGFELYHEIRKVDAKVKICFVTAFDIYSGEMKKEFHRSSNGKYQDKEEDDSDIIKCFIQKPVGIDELVKRVKEQLNS